MSASVLVILLIVGAAVGLVSGMLGIGGGVLVIPVLSLFFGFTHRQAVGTSLGMLLPPIGLFAFLAYWQAGQVDLRTAAALAAGFALGAWGGGWLANSAWISDATLQRFFGLFLVWYAANLFLKTDHHSAAVVWSLLAAGTFWAAALSLRLVGRRWERRFSFERDFLRRLERPQHIDYEI